jgi:acyl-CoA reductase-like NAD-dependent aldehyde dehydrogenase
MGVDKVAFTGSTEVGRKIMAASAESNLKKVSLELGGKSPNVIFADADLEQAIRGAVWAIFSTAGQECVAGSRLFIERSVYDQVVEGIAEQTARIRVGNGFGNAHIGPIVSEQQLERVMDYIEDGRKSGVEYLTGAERIGDEGYFVAPTVFGYEDDSLKLVNEEIFGPVVGATAFDDFDEVVARANQTPYGLAAGVWTKDVGKAHRFASAVRAGTVWINLYGYIDAAAPFGGYKQSGLGREMGADALDLYTETKAVWVNTAS